MRAPTSMQVELQRGQKTTSLMWRRVACSSSSSQRRASAWLSCGASLCSTAVGQPTIGHASLLKTGARTWSLLGWSGRRLTLRSRGCLQAWSGQVSRSRRPSCSCARQWPCKQAVQKKWGQVAACRQRCPGRSSKQMSHLQTPACNGGKMLHGERMQVCCQQGTALPQTWRELLRDASVQDWHF